MQFWILNLIVCFLSGVDQLFEGKSGKKLVFALNIQKSIFTKLNTLEQIFYLWELQVPIRKSSYQRSEI